MTLDRSRAEMPSGQPVEHPILRMTIYFRSPVKSPPALSLTLRWVAANKVWAIGETRLSNAAARFGLKRLLLY